MLNLNQMRAFWETKWYWQCIIIYKWLSSYTDHSYITIGTECYVQWHLFKVLSFDRYGQTPRAKYFFLLALVVVDWWLLLRITNSTTISTGKSTHFFCSRRQGIIIMETRTIWNCALHVYILVYKKPLWNNYFVIKTTNLKYFVYFIHFSTFKGYTHCVDWKLPHEFLRWFCDFLHPWIYGTRAWGRCERCGKIR